MKCSSHNPYKAVFSFFISMCRIILGEFPRERIYFFTWTGHCFCPSLTSSTHQRPAQRQLLPLCFACFSNLFHIPPTHRLHHTLSSDFRMLYVSQHLYISLDFSTGYSLKAVSFHSRHSAVDVLNG